LNPVITLFMSLHLIKVVFLGVGALCQGESQHIVDGLLQSLGQRFQAGF